MAVIFPVEVYSGGKLVVSGNYVSGMTIGNYAGYDASGNVMNVYSSGTVSDITVITGGQQNINGGTVSGTKVNAVGAAAGQSVSQNIYGGLVYDTVLTGGIQNIYGGEVNNTSAVDGALVNISNGIVSGMLIGSAGTEGAASGNMTGGSVSDLRVSGGTIEVSGGYISGVTIAGTGDMILQSGANVVNVDMDTPSGTSYLEISGGVVRNITLNNKGDRVLLYNGGSISETTINSGRVQAYGGVADTVTISGGTLRVENRDNVTFDGVVDIQSGGKLMFVTGATLTLRESSFISGMAYATGTLASLNISGAGNVDSAFADGKINATSYTLDGHAILLDTAYADPGQNIAYTVDGMQLKVNTLDSVLAGIGGADSELAQVNSLDGSVVFGGVITDSYTGGNFFGLKGSALDSAQTAVVDIKRGDEYLDNVIFGGGVNADFTGDLQVGVNAGNVKTVCGGGSGGVVSGNIMLDVNNATVGYVYGGGTDEVVDDGTGSGGNVSVAINSGAVVGTVYGGSYIKDLGGNTGTVANVNLAISDGATVSGNVYGGCRVDGSTAAVTTENVAVNVTGGSFGSYSMLAAGGFAVKGDGNGNDLTVTGSASLIWDGGIQNETMSCGRGVVMGAIAGTNTVTDVAVTSATFNSGAVNYIYGGGWGQNNGVSTVGSVNISVSGGDYGYLYGGGVTLGSTTTSTVDNVDIVLSGDASFLGVYVGGTTSNRGDNTINIQGNIKIQGSVTVSKFINGEDNSDTNLTLEDFTGSIGGIANFDTITISGATSVNGTCQMIGAATENWNFTLQDGGSSSALMTWAENSSNDFENDTINLNFSETDTSASWVLLSMSGSRGEDALNIDFESLTVYYNNKVVAESDWQLSREYNDQTDTYYLALNHK